jgi:hypothetical protein
MVKSRVVVNGVNLDLKLDTANIMTIKGNFVISLYIPENITDIVYLITPKDPTITTTTIVGKDLGLIVKTEKTIVIYGDVERINLVNDNGEVIANYTIKE